MHVPLRFRRMALAAVLLVLAGLQGGAQAGDTQAGGHGGSGEIRGDRYCEVLPVYRERLHLKVVVYNTIGHNDCPPDKWQALDPHAAAEELGAIRVVKNGPRHWAMDEIVGRGRSVEGETRSIGGITMTERATITMPLTDLLFGAEPYRTRTIERDTDFIYRPGTRIFELTDPEGHVYVMQTWAQIVDPELSAADLPDLGDRLQLPAGWHFSSRLLEAQLELQARGEAVVVQDDLNNTYQRR